MKKIKSAIILFIVLCNLTSVFGQERTILRGRVIDIDDKSTIVGANIVEFDKDNRIINGTTTNVSGDFVLTMRNPSNVVR